MSPGDRPSKRSSTRFDQQGRLASAEEATRLRRQLTSWLRDLGMSTDTVDTIGLASYEAMANVVIHAYPPGTVGRLAVSAQLDHDAITVTVTDRGRWKPALTGRRPLHGRGLLLIRRLAERVAVIRGEQGTTVSMTWPTRTRQPVQGY